MANRLDLDFSLQYADERTEFLNTYLAQEQFQKKPPNDEELETMSNYLLWGKSRDTGLNSRQEGYIKLDTKAGIWDNPDPAESLDALVESPTFNEAQISSLNSTIYTVKVEKFSRDEALAKAPPELIPIFRELFRRIDTTELLINFYDVLHNRRKSPPRDWLLNKFTDEEKAAMQETISHWSQFKYLKMRHQLVELRREQYTLKDSYAQIQFNETAVHPTQLPIDPITIEDGITVLPLGIIPSSKDHLPQIFRPFQEMLPGIFTDHQLKLVSEYYWKKRKEIDQFTGITNPSQVIDFRNPDHLYQLLTIQSEMITEQIEPDSELARLFATLKYYIDEANITPAYREIAYLKISHMHNADIAKQINQKYGSNYTDNYISTIFKQRVIPKMIEAAQNHLDVVGNIFFEEEFKCCTKCGQKLLRHSMNFMRKSKSKDGFAPRCKRCEKEDKALAYIAKKNEQKLV